VFISTGRSHPDPAAPGGEPNPAACSPIAANPQSSLGDEHMAPLADDVRGELLSPVTGPHRKDMYGKIDRRGDVRL